MKVSVQVRKLIKKDFGGLGIASASMTLIGHRVRDGLSVELFRLPIDGKFIDGTANVVKYYANPEGGVTLDEFEMEIMASESAQFSIKYSVAFDHGPEKLAFESKPAGNEVLELEQIPASAPQPVTQPLSSLEVVGTLMTPPAPPPAS